MLLRSIVCDTLIYNTLPPVTGLLVNQQRLWINKPSLTLEKKQEDELE